MPHWDEAEHPRWPAGAPDGLGGQWRSHSGVVSWAEHIVRRIVPPFSAWQDRATVEALADRAEYHADEPPTGLAGGAMAATEVRRVGGKPIVRKEYPSTVEGRRTAIAEELASRVAEAVRAPVPAAVVSEHDPSVVYMGWVPGDQASFSGLGPGEHSRDNEGVIYYLTQTRAGLRLGLLDVLIANTDRHSLNWLLSDYPEPSPIVPGQPVRMPIGIDHGEAFQVDSLLGLGYHGFMSPWIDFQSNGGWSPKAINPLHPDDVPILRARLQALRPKFEEFGWDRQHRLMMARFEKLAAHAGAKIRLFFDEEPS